jgi:hypothetical protein
VVDVQLVLEGRPAGARAGVSGLGRLDRGGQALDVTVEGVMCRVHHREIDLALPRTSALGFIAGHQNSLCFSKTITPRVRQLPGLRCCQVWIAVPARRP